ncbi:MAG: DUF3576 domain-containing protein [Rickettsiaceae bacterium]
MKSIIIVIFSIVSLLSMQAFASDYPQTKLEKEMDEMGSLLGGEGIIFRPKKEKSNATKAKIGNVNKYLFQAAIEVLKFAPLASADSKSGTIVTEWYTPKDQKDTQFKVMVYIKDDMITPEGLEVVAFERKKVKNGWSDNQQSPPISSVLEDKILRKARDLYLQSAR